MEDDLQLIERKLAGELTPPEEDSFARRLSNDPEFAEQYALGQAMIESLREQSLRQEMQQWMHKANHRRQRQRWQYGIAAVLASLLVAGAGLWYADQTQPTPTSLYETYYTVYPADPVLRGEPSADYGEAMDLYREEKYQAAIPLFEKADSTDAWIAIFLGNSYLNIGKTNEAIRYFSQVVQDEDRIVRQYGTWYLAMSYLKDNQIDQTRVLLEQLAEQPGIFQKKAQAMLGDLS